MIRRDERRLGYDLLSYCRLNFAWCFEKCSGCRLNNLGLTVAAGLTKRVSRLCGAVGPIAMCLNASWGAKDASALLHFRLPLYLLSVIRC
eukprot:scaffold189240_cov16-Prasinocladus_malaysianus.AAC.1